MRYAFDDFLNEVGMRRRKVPDPYRIMAPFEFVPAPTPEPEIEPTEPITTTEPTQPIETTAQVLQQKPAATTSAMQQLLQAQGAKSSKEPSWQEELSKFVKSDRYAALKNAAMIMANWHNDKLGELMLAAEKEQREAKENRLKELKTQQQRQLMQTALLQQGFDPLTAQAASANDAFMNQLMMAKRTQAEKLAQYDLVKSSYLGRDDEVRFAPKEGTKEWQERKDKHENELRMLHYRVKTHTNINQLLDQALELHKAGRFTTGALSSVASKLWGTDASKMQDLIETILGQRIVRDAAELKQKFGAIFGQLTERETGYIKALVGLLSQKLDSKSFAEAIGNIKNDMQQDYIEMAALDFPNVHYKIFQDNMSGQRDLQNLTSSLETLFNLIDPQVTGGYQKQIAMNRARPLVAASEEEAQLMADKLAAKTGREEEIWFVEPEQYQAWRRARGKTAFPQRRAVRSRRGRLQ